MMDYSSDLCPGRFIGSEEDRALEDVFFLNSFRCFSDDILSVIASFFTINDDSSKPSQWWLDLRIHTLVLIFLHFSRSFKSQAFVQWVNHALEGRPGEFKAVFCLVSACHVYNYFISLGINHRLQKPILPAVSSGNVFLNIPTHIIQDILVRLTPFEVGRCRCVCKPWLELLSQDEFVNLHLSQSQTGLIVHSISFECPTCLLGLVEIKDESNHHLVRYKAGMDRVIPGRYPDNYLDIVGSVNGLVCVDDQIKSICVWNPIMGESITIQTPRNYQNSFDVLTYGFGISSSGKYKVVRIFQKIGGEGQWRKQILDSTCHVYTLGKAGGFWKKIDHAPSFCNTCPQLGGLLLNGKLHWLVYDKNSTHQICCFDLESESFEPFPPPPKLPHHQIYFVTLNLYRGCISVCACDDNCPSKFDIVIWVMKGYGVENSWTKEVVISKFLRDGIDSPKLDHGIDYYNEAVHIIKVFEDGEILLLRKRCKFLFSYQPKTKTVKYFDIQEALLGPNFPSISPPTQYVSSLVSPKKLLQLGDVTEPPASHCVVVTKVMLLHLVGRGDACIGHPNY